MPLRSAVRVEATVVTIADVVAGPCAALYGPGATQQPLAMKQITLAVPAGGSQSAQNLSLYVPLPELPADLIKAGDRLMLQADVAPSPHVFSVQTQVVVLSRGGRLVLLTAFQPGSLPTLTEYGVKLTDEGISCVFDPSTIGACLTAQREVGVTFDGQTARARMGETVRVGDLTLLLSSFMSRVGAVSCDGPTPTSLAGYLSRPQ
jgi:hypothetical protein